MSGDIMTWLVPLVAMLAAGLLAGFAAGIFGIDFVLNWGLFFDRLNILLRFNLATFRLLCIIPGDIFLCDVIRSVVIALFATCILVFSSLLLWLHLRR